MDRRIPASKLEARAAARRGVASRGRGCRVGCARLDGVVGGGAGDCGHGAGLPVSRLGLALASGGARLLRASLVGLGGQQVVADGQWVVAVDALVELHSTADLGGGGARLRVGPMQLVGDLLERAPHDGVGLEEARPPRSQLLDLRGGDPAAPVEVSEDPVPDRLRSCHRGLGLLLGLQAKGFRRPPGVGDDPGSLGARLVPGATDHGLGLGAGLPDKDLALGGGGGEPAPDFGVDPCQAVAGHGLEGGGTGASIGEDPLGLGRSLHLQVGGGPVGRAQDPGHLLADGGDDSRFVHHGIGRPRQSLRQLVGAGLQPGQFAGHAGQKLADLQRVVSPSYPCERS